MNTIHRPLSAAQLRQQQVQLDAAIDAKLRRAGQVAVTSRRRRAWSPTERQAAAEASAVPDHPATADPPVDASSGALQEKLHKVTERLVAAQGKAKRAEQQVCRAARCHSAAACACAVACLPGA